MRRTKIVCTVGPATASAPLLRELIAAGADVLRLNFAHGTPVLHRELAQHIRAVAAELGKPVAILQDLPGPKIRLGTFQTGSVELRTGEPFTLTTLEVPGDAHRASVSYPRLAEEVAPGQSLLLADGAVELRIEAVSPPEIHCRVVVGGVLSSHKGVTVPRGALSLAAFTPQDQEHLRVGLALGADIVALSFVRSPADIAALRAFLAEHQAEVPVMAKIEKPEALDVFDALLASVDAVMVARGDLGVEVPLAEVPLIQKRLVHQAVQAAKPVVVATQMLRSMVDNPRPTRAEAADVANAVFDGADALMLSEETAVGAYPVAAVRVMADIVAAAERHWLAQRGTTFFATPETCSPSAALAHAACLLALEARAAAIVCCTRTGRTAQLVARHRPRTPIVAVSPAASTVRRLMLTWGVVPVQAEGFTSTDAMLQAALAAARQSGVVQPGERVVVVGGAPTAPPGHTDFLRLAVVR